MDYLDILKGSWQVTWRYKILWLFGLFAAGAGGGSSWNTSYQFSGDETMYGTGSVVDRWLAENLGIILAVTGVLMLIALAWWILSVAAEGGLIALVQEAREDRTVSAGAGWSVGFDKWFPMFGVRFLLGLPFVLIVLIGVGAAVMIGVGSFSVDDPTSALTGVVGICGLVAVLIVVVLVMSLVIDVIRALALRYVVLEEMGVVDALRLGYSELVGRFKDLLLMWLILFGVGMVYGMVVAAVSMILVLPAGFMLLTGNFLGLLLVFGAGLIMLFPNAVWATFRSAAWTIFFRRFTGMEIPPAVAAMAAAPSPGAPRTPPAGDLPPPPSL